LVARQLQVFPPVLMVPAVRLFFVISSSNHSNWVTSTYKECCHFSWHPPFLVAGTEIVTVYTQRTSSSHGCLLQCCWCLLYWMFHGHFNETALLRYAYSNCCAIRHDSIGNGHKTVWEMAAVLSLDSYSQTLAHTQRISFILEKVAI
jgi:hypothetical protein